MHNKLSKEWVSYKSQVIPLTAPPIQHQECRRAFYAGAAAMLALVRGVETDDEDAAIAELEALQNEVNEFLSRVGREF